MEFDKAVEKVHQVFGSIEQSIIGQNTLVKEVLCTLLSRGHILLTGAPGLGKTVLVKVLASHLEVDHSRIQFTPDLLPSDIVGSEILNSSADSSIKAFEFRAGPIFSNVILADEINRASPRTQSALLEAMQERKVTVSGKTHVLKEPFMVLATQNPLEYEGTFPLPEAQLDRFLLSSFVDYPSAEDERQILAAHTKSNLVGENWDTFVKSQKKKMTKFELEQIQLLCSQVFVDDSLLSAINTFVRSTRPRTSSNDQRSEEKVPSEIGAEKVEITQKWIRLGAGPRASIAIISASRSMAFLQGSQAVHWGHIREVLKPVLRHRIQLTMEAYQEGRTIDDVIDSLTDEIEKTVELKALGEHSCRRQLL